MDNQLKTIVESVTKLLSNSQHEYYAKKYLKAGGDNILALVQHYEYLRKNRPSTYTEEIVSGRMARLFKKAVAIEKNTTEEIWVIVNIPEALAELKEAIIAKNPKEKVSDVEAEATAFYIIQMVMKETKNIKKIRKLLAEKSAHLRTKESTNAKAVDTALGIELHSNYLT